MLAQSEAMLQKTYLSLSTVMVLGSLMALASCEEGNPAPQCGSRGVWESRADTSGCELTWLCNDNVERQQSCVGAEGAEQECSCYEDGLLVDSFTSNGACSESPTEIKVECGW